MKRRNFLAAAAASIAVPVNIDSWNKFLESDCDEMVWHEATQTWHRLYKVDLTTKKVDHISNAYFWKTQRGTVHAGIQDKNHDIYMNESNFIPLQKEKFSIKEKQDLLNTIIKLNKGRKVFMAEIRIGEATNIYGWAE